MPARTRKLRISVAPELVEKLASGLALSVIGSSGLAEPLGRLYILARSEAGPAGKLALAAALTPGGSRAALALAPLGLGRLAGVLKPPAELLERFPGRLVRSGIVFQDAAGHDRFAVTPGTFNQLVVAAGRWPVLVPLVQAAAPARQFQDAAGLAAELRAFCTLLTAVLEAVYARQGLAAPPLAIRLMETGLKVDRAVSGLRQVGRTAASVARVAGQSPRVGTRQREQLEPQLSFADVGGLESAKSELAAVSLALREPGRYKQWGARGPRGVLLHGPPGTGKTLLARCLARESGAAFVHVRVTDVVSKWYGESEQRLQQAFDQARRDAPAVLFFDEIDALARDREGAHEVTHRLVSTMLENMDGLEPTVGVVVVAATNRPQAVDPALTRPGRFDRLVEVPLPDPAARRAILEVRMRRAAEEAGRPLFDDFGESDWAALAAATERFSGAELEETVRRALEARVRAGAADGRLDSADLLREAAGVKPAW
jgi:AAA+ superfamily predicted ATPase